MAGEFSIRRGSKSAEHFFSDHPDILAVTQQDIWENVEKFFAAKPQNLYMLQGLEIDFLEKLAERNVEISAVVGIGGGRAADIAKYLHWKNGIQLYQIPTIISVDAFFTHEVAVRDGGVVKYIGDAVPEEIVIDYEILKSAPIELNRSGLGDILSCHTGLYDWKLAAEKGHKPIWNEELADETHRRLSAVLEGVSEIRDMSRTGVDLLVDMLNWIGFQCFKQQHPRFEEGSEHHFVYNLEYQTDKHFVHGQAVCLGCLISSVLQDNDPDMIASVIAASGIDIRPEALGVSWDEIALTLETLNEFVRKEQLPYTVLYEKPIEDSLIETIKAQLA
jgi:glycerol dehydrogenase-like iron-containing ADH family enzyme